MLEKLYENKIEELDRDSLKKYLLILNKADELLDELETSDFISNLLLLNESVVYKKCVNLSSIGVTSISLIISAEEKPKLTLRHGSVFKKFNLLYNYNIYYCIYKIEVNSLFSYKMNLSENDCGFFIEYTDFKVGSSELYLTNTNLTIYSESNPLNIDSFIDSVYCHFGQLKLLKDVKCNYLSIEQVGSNYRDMSKYKQILLNIIKNVHEYMIIRLLLDESFSSLCNSLDDSSIFYEKYCTNEEYIIFINVRRN